MDGSGAIIGSFDISRLLKGEIIEYTCGLILPLCVPEASVFGLPSEVSFVGEFRPRATLAEWTLRSCQLFVFWLGLTAPEEPLTDEDITQRAHQAKLA